MDWQWDDGGRRTAGYKRQADDCVVRALAIAMQRPYNTVYQEIKEGAWLERPRKGCVRSNPRKGGVFVNRVWFKRYMEDLGWKWVPTMFVGKGCKIHLRDGDLPHGRIIARISHHVCAVINGVIRDTHDPSRNGKRCVYGYWEHM